MHANTRCIISSFPYLATITTLPVDGFDVFTPSVFSFFDLQLWCAYLRSYLLYLIRFIEWYPIRYKSDVFHIHQHISKRLAILAFISNILPWHQFYSLSLVYTLIRFLLRSLLAWFLLWLLFSVLLYVMPVCFYQCSRIHCNTMIEDQIL